jgi:2-dehydropantoate 2-reductase
MLVAVFGSGGVGGFFGGKLAQAGEEVIFIARGSHLEAIRRDGLRVESVGGDFHIFPARAESDPGAVGRVDIVLVGVKAWQVAEAAQAIRSLVGPATIVIPLQNGVEAAVQLAAVLGEQHVTGGLCRISCLVAGPGLIRHVGIEPTIGFNWLDGHADARLEALQAAFGRAGVRAELPADIQVKVWEKFVFIAAISGIGAVTRAPAGVLRSTPETRRMLEAAIYEAAAVGRASGVALSEQLEENTLRLIDSLPVGTMASMQRDISENRPSELECQSGAVVRLGQAYGVPTPVHAFIYASLLPQEARAHGQTSF